KCNTGEGGRSSECGGVDCSPANEEKTAPKGGLLTSSDYYKPSADKGVRRSRLWHNIERHIAGEIAARRCNFDGACGCARRHLRFEVSVGHDRKLCRSSVERHAGGPGEIVAQNFDDLSD